MEVLKEIKKPNGWQPGDTVRVVVHSFKPLKKMELARIMKDAVATVGNEQNMEFAFLTVTQKIIHLGCSIAFNKAYR